MVAAIWLADLLFVLISNQTLHLTEWSVCAPVDLISSCIVKRGREAVIQWGVSAWQVWMRAVLRWRQTNDVAQNDVRCAPFESSCQTASKSLLRLIETQSLELELEVVPNCSKVSICCDIWNILVPKNIFHSTRHSCNPLHLCLMVCFWFYCTKWGLSMAVSWACHVRTIQQQQYHRNL